MIDLQLQGKMDKNFRSREFIVIAHLKLCVF